MVKRVLEDGEDLGVFRGYLNEMFADMYAGAIDRILQKPTDEPIFVVATGQSNMFGVYPFPGLGPEFPHTPVPDWSVNQNVYDWQGPDSVQAPDSFSWVPADPFRTQPPSFPKPENGILTGMRGEGYGHIGYAFCDTIQKLTGRDVYMVTTSWSGQAIAEWADGASIEAELSLQVSTAKATLGLVNDAPDFVLWMQGESDASRHPRDYALDWSAFKANMESKWAKRLYTRWLICGVHPFYGQGGSNEDTPEQWGGCEFAASNEDQYVQYVSSRGTDITFDITWHYTGPGLKDMGVRAALIAAGMPVNDSVPPISNILSNGDAQLSTLTDSSTKKTAFEYDTINELTDTNGVTFLARWLNKGLEKFRINFDGSIFNSDFASNLLGFFQVNRPLVATQGFVSLVGDAADAVAYVFDTTADMITSGAKLFSFRNFGLEKAYVDKDGRYFGEAYASEYDSGDEAQGTVAPIVVDESGNQTRGMVRQIVNRKRTTDDTGVATAVLIMNAEDGTQTKFGRVRVLATRIDSVDPVETFVWDSGWAAQWQAADNYEVVVENTDFYGSAANSGVSVAIIDLFLGAPGVLVVGIAGQTWEWTTILEYTITEEIELTT